MAALPPLPPLCCRAGPFVSNTTGELIEVSGLSKRFCSTPWRALPYAAADIARELFLAPESRENLRPGEFWALRNVSLSVDRGEVVGVVGHNGAGKSTLVNLMAGLLRPTAGQVVVRTDSVVLLDSRGGLSPHLTGRENIENRLTLLGWKEEDIREAIGDITDYSGLDAFVDAPVGTYSTGMKVRLGLSVYAATKPDLLIVDEALSGGDVRFRMKFHGYLREHVKRGGSILLASHDLATMQSLCRRCILLHGGEVRAFGAPEEVIHEYLELMKAADLPRKRSSFLADDVASEPLADADRSPKVAIKDVEVSERTGGHAMTLGATEIRVTCEARRPVKGVVWMLEIGCGEIFPLATSVTGYEKEYSLEAGTNVLTCVVAPLPLLPGIYQLRVSLRERDSGRPLARRGYLDLPFTFEVDGDAHPGLNLARSQRGFVNLPIRWD